MGGVRIRLPEHIIGKVVAVCGRRLFGFLWLEELLTYLIKLWTRSTVRILR